MKKTQRQHIWLVVLVFITQLLLAGLSFFVPVISTWLKSVSTGELIIGYLSLETTIIAAGLTWLHYQQAERQQAFEERFISSTREIAYCRRLGVHEFYSSFLTELTSCKIGVNIAYLGSTPPTVSSDKVTKKYYDDSVAIMKRRSHEALSFRRIVRLTKSNWAWILSLCQQLQDISTFSMAVLDDSGDEIRNPLALSVQTVDEERAYLIAVYERDDFIPYRDLMISSPIAATALVTYFDRLWARSTPIIQEGRANEANIHRLQTIIDGRQ